MGFITGSKNVATIIADLAAGLAAGADWSMVDEAVAGGYALLYAPDNTYVTIRAHAGVGFAYSNASYPWAGIAVIFSTDFDTMNHVPAGTVYQGAIPLSWNSGATAVAIGNDRLYPVNIWVDNSGFVMSYANAYALATSVGGVAMLEVIPAAKREFSDGYRALMFHCNPSGTKSAFFDYPDVYTPDNPAIYYLNVRPFAQACCTSLMNYTQVLDAFRSLGNSKIYFEFPWYHNACSNGTATPTPDHYNTPIYQTRRFFYVRKTGGLAVNDIIQWLDVDGVTVRKFIITDITSPTTNPAVYAAIPYDSAYVY